MRKLTVRDLLGTLIVAAVVVPFIGYSVRGSMPFVQDPRGMAGVGIVGALLAILAFGRRSFGTGTFEWVMMMLIVLTLGFGIAALIAETTWWLLVPMLAGLVIMWILALMHDAGYTPRGHTAAHAWPTARWLPPMPDRESCCSMSHSGLPDRLAVSRSW